MSELEINLQNCEEDKSSFPRKVENFEVFALKFEHDRSEDAKNYIVDLWNSLSKNHSGLIYRRLPEIYKEELYSIVSFRVAPKDGNSFKYDDLSYIKQEYEEVKLYA